MSTVAAPMEIPWRKMFCFPSKRSSRKRTQRSQSSRSRMPVREALILLEYQGLVRRLPNNHVRVAELSGDCLDHIFELGLALEAEVLEKWADPEELPDEELEFHRYLYEKCPFDFQRKMLETFTEIYLCFGIRARDHKLEKDPAGGLKAYLEEIKQAIIKERGKINAGVKTD